MNKVDLSDFYAETESSETRAYEHALDIEFIVHREMKRLGLSKSELANRMGISLQSLSKLLNSQPNMTLKTIAKFELALGIKIVPQVIVGYSKELPFLSSNNSVREQCTSPGILPAGLSADCDVPFQSESQTLNEPGSDELPYPHPLKKFLKQP